MIEIQNINFNGVTGTFDATIDGQLIEGCRAVISRQHGKIDAIPPQHAAHIDWGDHSIADISDAFRTIVNNFGNID